MVSCQAHTADTCFLNLARRKKQTKREKKKREEDKIALKKTKDTVSLEKLLKRCIEILKINVITTFIISFFFC